jgi:hypothetical protein
MNGWQRIGIVAFLIWAPVAFVWFWIAAHDARPHYDYCTSMYQGWIDNNVPDRLEKSQQCSKQAEAAFFAAWEEQTRDFWRYVWLFIAVPPLVIWGLISVVIVTVRWIRKGFAQEGG